MRKKGGSIKGKLTRWAISRLRNSRTFPIVMNAIRRKFTGGSCGGCRGKGLRLAGSGTTLAGGRKRTYRRRR